MPTQDLVIGITAWQRVQSILKVAVAIVVCVRVVVLKLPQLHRARIIKLSLSHYKTIKVVVPKSHIIQRIWAIHFLRILLILGALRLQRRWLQYSTLGARVLWGVLELRLLTAEDSWIGGHLLQSGTGSGTLYDVGRWSVAITATKNISAQLTRIIIIIINYLLHAIVI